MVDVVMWTVEASFWRTHSPGRLLGLRVAGHPELSLHSSNEPGVLSQRLLPRDAMHPRYMLWPSVCVCVCVCLCLSVTSRNSTKTAKCRIIQTTPHDSTGTLVVCCQRSPRNSTGVTLYGGAKCRWGGSKSATFDK